jgi:hypothetical protein
MPTSVRVELDPLPKNDPAVIAIMHEQTETVARIARTLVPVKTGKLRSSIVVSVNVTGQGTVGRVAATAPHALWVHDGTRGPIRPKNAKMLSWVGAGGRIYARQVRGQKAQPFLTRALSAAGLHGVRTT